MKNRLRIGLFVSLGSVQNWSFEQVAEQTEEFAARSNPLYISKTYDVGWGRILVHINLTVRNIGGVDVEGWTDKIDEDRIVEYRASVKLPVFCGWFLDEMFCAAF